MEINQISQKKRYVPSSFVVLFAIMLIFVIASWIGSTFSSSINKVGLLDIFPVSWKGFAEKAPVILFIFSIGGTLGVMTKLRAIDAGIQALVLKLKGKEWLLIVTLTFVFGLNGTTYGLWEETIVFFPVLIPIFIKAGYGPFIAVATILIGSGTGVLASTINPFAIGTAVETINHSGHDFNITSTLGQGQRWIVFIIFEIAASVVLLLMAKHSKKTGGVIKNLNNQVIARRFNNNEIYVFTWKRKLILMLFSCAFILMILGFMPWAELFGFDKNASGPWDSWMWWLASTNGTWEKLGSWTFISAAAIFLIITIIIFALTFNEFKNLETGREEDFIHTYAEGIKEMVPVALLIGLASGLGIILEQTKFGLLMANSIAAVAASNLILWGLVVFIISLFLSFLIPSTSGFASAFMGIFATSIALATPEQKVNAALALTILAFILASGITNLWSPTSPALVAYTAYSKIPYFVWIKQTYWIDLIYLALALLVVVICGFLAESNILF